MIRSPLGYRLRCRTVVVEARAARCLRTAVGGDLVGEASLELSPEPDGCRVRLDWSLSLERPGLRDAARVARPAMQWAHDRVVERGLEQFRTRALPGE